VSVSSVDGAASPPAYPQIASTGSLASKNRAIDGDYRTPIAMSSHVKDGDGDYRRLTASPAARSSPAVQTNLSMLKTGG
jgi:hypothetical protein